MLYPALKSFSGRVFCKCARTSEAIRKDLPFLAELQKYPLHN